MDEIIGAVFGVLVVQTGKLVVRFASFGCWRGEDLSGEEGRVYGAAGALSFVRDGQRVVTQTGLLFAGAAFYVTLFVAMLVLFGVI